MRTWHVLQQAQARCFNATIDVVLLAQLKRLAVTFAETFPRRPLSILEPSPSPSTQQSQFFFSPAPSSLQGFTLPMY